MTSHHQHSSTINLSGFQVREHLVDVVELGPMDFRSHLALRCKCNGFCEVLPAAHDGAANRYAVQDDIEDGRLKFPWRKTDKADGALAPHHTERLAKSCRGHCGDKDAVGAPAGLLDNLRGRIRRFGVDRYFRA